MTFRFLLAILCLTTLSANAQQNPELIHSGDQIEKGVEAHDEGNYEEALEHYNKVHPADTNYLTALYERTLTHLEMENYEKVVELCEKGIALDYHQPEVYNTYGSALDYLEKREESLEVYDRGLEKFPYNMSLLFNRAVVYESMDNREKTIEELKELVEFNPFHSSSHIRLGMLSSVEGELAQAIMPMIVALAIEPGSGRSFTILSYADQVSSGGADDIGSDDKNAIEPEFEELDLIIKNRLAINDKYETPSDLSFPVIKQAHLIMSQIQKGEAESDGFWGAYYGPILKWVMDTHQFEEFALLISLSVDDQYVQNLIEKNIDDIRTFRNDFVAKFRELHADYKITHDGQELAVEKWFHDDFSLQALGAEDNAKENDGFWKYYYPTGQIETIGTFDRGDRIGKWVSFNTHGDTSRIHNFADGKLNGTYKLFHDNGLLSEIGNYEDGDLEGELKGYFSTGQLRVTLVFQDGERNGPVKYYYKTGELEQEMRMVENELDGEMIEYYPSGQVSSRTNFEEGEKEGVAEVYYPDGTLSQKTVFEDNLLEGPYVTYFQNGQVKSSGNAANGSVAGEWKYFYEDGSLRETSDFSDNGKINGESISYDMNEKPYQIEEFRQGDLQRITFLNADGTEISSVKERRGELSTEFYNYRREIISEGTYEDGERSGLWKYFENGELEEEENYLEGDFHGENTSYFVNGNVSFVRDFKYGEATGYYISNYSTDTLYAEGNYFEDNRECTWYYYFPNGVMKSKNWYQKGQAKGEQIGYSVVGLPETITLYD
jgi:antitoxin component YwqK of YwqJK toxin-antitoxin module/Tfp pilus assembly protein PilF